MCDGTQKNPVAKIQEPTSKEFIHKHLKEDCNSLRLKYSGKDDLPYSQLIDQIEARQRLGKKNPEWMENEDLVFPPRISLEQSSSSLTARYKAGLFSGKVMADLTGGMGVDSAAFAERFDKVHYCEQQIHLTEIARHNFKVLDLPVTTHHIDGIKYLRRLREPVDLLYLDPARRSKGNKVIGFSDYTPNILEHLSFILEKGEHVIIKASPMMDIKKGISELQGVEQVHVVSAGNECKELLFILRKGMADDPEILAVHIEEGKANWCLTSASKASEFRYSAPLTYLYLPNPSIMKSGLFDHITHHEGLFKLSANTHLYTSKEKLEFPGKCFHVKSVHSPYKVAKKEKFNVMARNFPGKP